MTRTLLRAGRDLAAGGLLLAALTACTPSAAPTPQPTATAAFTSDAEAFAAAEETYRAYTAAMNAVDLANPESLENLYRYSTGEFQAADKETYSKLHAQGLRMTGEVRVTKFQGTEFDVQARTIEARICVDVSRSDVVDASGHSHVAADRPDMNALRVRFEADGHSTRIARAERDDEGSCVIQ